MTPRERAGAVWDMFTLDLTAPGENRPPVTVQRIILAIEQAIIAAEESKAKTEREACARVVEEEYRQSLLRNDPNPGIDPLLTATKIRARS
jgi:hypothetical protein